MRRNEMLIAVAIVVSVLLFSTLACTEGGLLDTQPCPPIFKTERAATLTR